jgi:hypothetical protein
VLYGGHPEHALLLSAQINGAPVTFLGKPRLARPGTSPRCKRNAAIQ